MIYPSRAGGDSPGTISVLCLGPTELRSRRSGSSAVSVQHDRYTWRAPRDARGPLPTDRSVSFDVYTAADGVRRFVPCAKDGFNGYVARAFQYGHSLLARDRNFDWCRWCDYLLGKLAYDRLLHVQERIKRGLGSVDSLMLSQNLHQELGQKTVLPKQLGRGAAKSGKAWSIDDVIDQGRRAAQEDGIQNPTETDAINYGLFAAARTSPLGIQDRQQISSLMRIALYDLSDVGERVSAAEQEEVSQRFHDLIRGHLWEEQEQFQKWFAGGNSNLIKAIANRRDEHGQRMTPAVVKRALHDLGWRGYFLVAECLEAFARAFTRALRRRRIQPRELGYFQGMYYRQDYFGGLPLVLVMDRSPQIQPAVIRLWKNPGDTDMIGVLHQVLWWHAEMVPLRRAAYCLAKEKTQGRAPCFLPLDENISPAAGDEFSAEDLYRHLLERRRVRCSLCDQSPHAILATENIRPGSPIQLQIQCESHGDVGIVEIPWEELEAARPLLADQPRPALDRSDRRRGV